jgi:type 1 fimbriae regulatory protein FimB/type 1 fimbriae regulatory protein FimE
VSWWTFVGSKSISTPRPSISAEPRTVVREALRREHPHADFVFLSECKATLSVDGAQKLIERLGESAELPFPIHAHMLRHAAGYALAARGIDTRTLQAFMGHRSIANTVVYTAVADKRIRNIWGK